MTGTNALRKMLQSVIEAHAASQGIGGVETLVLEIEQVKLLESALAAPREAAMPAEFHAGYMAGYRQGRSGGLMYAGDAWDAYCARLRASDAEEQRA